jgi:hypothetical protein
VDFEPFSDTQPLNRAVAATANINFFKVSVPVDRIAAKTPRSLRDMAIVAQHCGVNVLTPISANFGPWSLCWAWRTVKNFVEVFKNGKMRKSLSFIERFDSEFHCTRAATTAQRKKGGMMPQRQSVMPA